MNFISKSVLACRVAANQAWKAARVTYRKPGIGRAVLNRYEAGERWLNGDRSYIWSQVADARFDANSATRYEIVRKAIYFESNCPLVQRLADVWEQYVVGANGLILSPDSSDENWNEAESLWFDEWAVYPDLTSLQTWTTLQTLIARTWFIQGEVFLLKTRGETPPFRPRLQLIEGHRVGTPGNMAAAEGKRIIDGVEIDEKGRPVAYWVQTGFDSREFTRIPADNIIHIFEPNRIGMYRGLSMFYAVMNPLHDLDDLQRLEMQAAKDAAETTKIIKTPTGELLDDAAEWNKRQETGEDGQPNPLTEFYRRIFGATTKIMKTGDEYEQIVSNRPSVAQQWYWRYLAEQVCNGVGIPLCLCYPESMQGTVYRGALETANAFFRSRSAVLAASFIQVRNYAIDSGSRFDSRIANKPKDWKRVIVRPPRAVNVDVGRNSSAMLAELKSGTRTFQDIYAELGEDWKVKLRQKAREARYLRLLAIEFSDQKAKIIPQEISDIAVDAIVTPEPPKELTTK